jgi:hypothetical protein
MFTQYKVEFLATPWGFVAFFFMVLVVLHFVLLEISPWGSENFQTTKLLDAPATISATSRSPSSTGLGEARILEGLWKGFGAGSKEEVPARPISGIAKPEGEKSLALYPEDSDEEYVAICLAVRGQSQDLVEFFIHHYYHLGIRRFYIMDDGSEPPLSTFDYPGVPRKVLSFHYFSRATARAANMQDAMYDTCIRQWRHEHTWMAFIDADEMLEMTGEETLKELLTSLEKNKHVGALAVNWQTHSSNGVLKRPVSSRKAFTDCIWDGAPTHNGIYKSIVKTKFYAEHNGVQRVNLTGGTLTVGEDGISVPAKSRFPPTRNRIALHNYALKSREEYGEKVDQSRTMDQPMTWDFWDNVESMARVDCPSMATNDP